MMKTQFAFALCCAALLGTSLEAQVVTPAQRKAWHNRAGVTELGPDSSDNCCENNPAPDK